MLQPQRSSPEAPLHQFPRKLLSSYIFPRAECRSVVAIGVCGSVAKTHALSRTCASAQEITAWQLEWMRRKHDCSGEGFKDPLRAYMTC